MRFAPHTLPRLAMVFALMLAMASSGFAHSFNRAEASADYADFVAAGGSLSDLCGGSIDPNHATPAKCEACRLVAAAVIPSHPTGLGLISARRPAARARLAEPLRQARWLDPSHPTRAPPATLASYY
ncbi:hypothetical protein [Phaeobacter porticola]|nr:hypothetical protein [Phaeobacter porticola]